MTCERCKALIEHEVGQGIRLFETLTTNLCLDCFVFFNQKYAECPELIENIKLSIKEKIYEDQKIANEKTWENLVLAQRRNEQTLLKIALEFINNGDL